jgi:hypothetical protein
MPATLGSALTTTVWVVVRIHRRTANVRTYPLPAIAARFTNQNRVMVCVADFPDGRSATIWNTSNFPAGELQLRPSSFAGH